MKKIKKKIEYWVDKSNPKVIDKISLISFSIIGIISLYLFISTFKIIVSPIVDIHPKFLYTVLLLFDIALFYFTMLGEQTNKPINRPRIFLLVSLIMGLNMYSLLVETINHSFTNFLNSLIAITEVPSYLLISNIRIMSIYIPIFIVMATLGQSISIPFKKESKKELLEYSVDILTRNVNEVSERTINLKLCEDIETGEDIILTENSSKQHTLIGGSSGSGKTALVYRPILAQLFYQKAEFREKLKKLAYQCLEEGICYVKLPITNKYMNEHFSMDLIGIKSGRREEFLEIFKDYIIGVREGVKVLYNNTDYCDNIIIPLRYSDSTKNTEIKIKVYSSDLIKDEYEFTYQDGNIIGNDVALDDYTIKISIDTDQEVDELIQELLNINIEVISEKRHIYKFEVYVAQHNEGKIIYRDLGVTVVAPDGGLPSNTVDIVNKNGIKVHKVDPKMEEIEKGEIAKFNPLMVGTPEKAADVISSILVAMEQTTGKDANPYFTNASIRAIRNLVILLRVTYPKLRGKNPTLIDVLDILNNFNLVKEYVEELRKDSRLEMRWKSVIDYFVTSFYPQPKDEKGNIIYGTNEGVNRKKTAESISGVINQLDNLLGREELRYILCDAEHSLNLSEVLEKGECLAIATRQSELGSILGKAFALLFILSMQNAVLCRYSEDENPEVPHYLAIDEFPFYLNENLGVFFTFSRKYKCSLICAIQNIAQLCEESEVFKQIVFSNTDTKLILPGSNVEDRKYYSELLGTEEVFETQTGVSKNPIFSENANYSETTRGSMQEKAKASEEDVSNLKFKRCYYVYTNPKGKKCVGKGFIDFLKFTDDNIIHSEYYDFEKYMDKNAFSVLNNDRLDNDKESMEPNTINLFNRSEELNIYKDIQAVELDELELATEEEYNENNINDIEFGNNQIDESNNKNEEPLISPEPIIRPKFNMLEQKLMSSIGASSDLDENNTDKDKLMNTIIDEVDSINNLDDINLDELSIEGLSDE